MGTIIWLIGTVLAIMAVMDVFKKNISTGWKIIWSVLLLVTEMEKVFLHPGGTLFL